MKKIHAVVFISLMIFMSSAHPIASNFFRQPTCHDDVSTLPIFELRVKFKGEDLKHGTTFLIQKDMWATANHVVNNIDNEVLKHYIIMPDGSTIEAKILKTDPINDIAILYAPSGNMVPMNLLSATLTKYEPVWNIGIPGVTNKRMISFEGIILGTINNIYLSSSAIAFSGMSGGPQVRCNGNQLEVASVIVITQMGLFSSTRSNLPDGTIVIQNQYQIKGSKSSPHIAQNMVDLIFESIDNKSDHN